MPESSPEVSRLVRIGGASGFWGDSAVGAPQLVFGADIDYLVFDYLAETTMAILAGMRAKKPELGYATDFVDVAMRSVVGEISRHGIKVVSNAGGINPRGCAEALRKVAAEAGVALRIAVVEGDDVMGRLPELPEGTLSANAYLGALPIARALALGADVVITGRCVDSAVTLGPLIHEFGWNHDDYDRLAMGSLAGHIIECGCQATGGLFTDWQSVPDWAGIGYPVVECAADGGFVVTKPAGTGGLVSEATVAEQIVYEIGDPGAYVLPDVVCDFREVRLVQEGADRVRVSGAKGRAPPSGYKVSATRVDGFRAAGTMVIVGIDAAAKARRTAEAILGRTRAMFSRLGFADYAATRIEVIGAETLYGPHGRAGAAREVMMRVVADHPQKAALELFAREIAPAGTSWSPGTTSPGGGRPGVSPRVRQFALSMDKHRIEVRVSLDAASETIAIPCGGAVPPAPTLADIAPLLPSGPTEEVPLIRLAWARSGDKGDTANIGVIARRPEYLPLILGQLTDEAVKAYFAHLVEGEVRHYLLPGFHAVNFVLEQALDGGGTASMRMDPLGKGLAQMLLDFPVRVPVGLLT